MFSRSTNLFLELLLKYIRLRPGRDSNLGAMKLNTHSCKTKILERDMNRKKVIKQVSVLKTPNAYRDAGKSTTVRQNKQ